MDEKQFIEKSIKDHKKSHSGFLSCIPDRVSEQVLREYNMLGISNKSSCPKCGSNNVSGKSTDGQCNQIYLKCDSCNSVSPAVNSDELGKIDKDLNLDSLVNIVGWTTLNDSNSKTQSLDLSDYASTFFFSSSACANLRMVPNINKINSDEVSLDILCYGPSDINSWNFKKNNDGILVSYNRVVSMGSSDKSFELSSDVKNKLKEIISQNNFNLSEESYENGSYWKISKLLDIDNPSKKVAKSLINIDEIITYSLGTSCYNDEELDKQKELFREKNSQYPKQSAFDINNTNYKVSLKLLSDKVFGMPVMVFEDEISFKDEEVGYIHLVHDMFMGFSLFSYDLKMPGREKDYNWRVEMGEKLNKINSSHTQRMLNNGIVEGKCRDEEFSIGVCIYALPRK